MPKRKEEEYVTASGETPIGEMRSGRTDGHIKKGEETLTDSQRTFLAVYGEMGVIKRACKVAGVARSSHYEWLEGNPEYKRAFEDAQEDAADSLEAEVYRRAVKGVRKATGWYKGVAGGYVREYSDLLLMFRLKALRPEQYRERVEMRGVLANVDLTKLPDALIARLAAGENLNAVRAGAVADGLNPQTFLKEPLGLPAASEVDGGVKEDGIGG